MHENGWDKWGDIYEKNWVSVMDRICRAAAIAPGMRVLDLACGTGQPALPAARLVGPKGTVVASDVDRAMVEATRRRAREAGLGNVDVLEMNMHDVRFPDASFDAVTLGFALMFSPEPTKVTSEIRRVLKPGARVAVAVWGAPEKNAFCTTMFSSIAEVTHAPPPPPDAPGPSRFSGPGEIDEVLRNAGFTDVTVEPVPFVVESASPGDHFQMFYDVALKSKIDALSPADGAQLRTLFASKLEPFVANGRVRVSATALVASGRR
jgi:SAM-dependent methyltransferase